MSYRKRIDEVWEKGIKIPGKDPNKYREDRVGNVIYKNSYGKNSDMGWNIDHSKPQSEGGTDNLNNLQPMHSSQNSSKNASYPYNYEKSEPLGKTVYDIADTDVDRRSFSYVNGKILLNMDGTIDGRSSAVRNGDIILNKDGTINGNSRAVKNGNIKFKYTD